MFATNWLRSLGVASGGLAIILLIVQIVAVKRRRLKQAAIPKRHVFGRRVYALNQLLSKMPIISKYLNSIESRVAISRATDESVVIYQATKIFLLASALTLVVLALLVAFIDRWYAWLMALLILYFILESIVDYFVNRIKLSLLEQTVTFIDYLRITYFETTMIDDAYILAIDKLEFGKADAMSRQAELIREVVTAPDGELALQRYYQMAPNAYLKLLAGLSFIVAEHGDSKDRDGSSFIKSLTHLSSEIKDEIIKRNRLLIGLKSMNVIAVAPLLAMEPLKQWASHSFYLLGSFYRGAFGFAVEIGLLLIIFSSFILLRKLQNYDDFDERGPTDYRFEKYLASRMKWYLDAVMPSRKSTQYQRVKARQRRAHVFSKIEYHYIRKTLFGLFALLVAVSVLTTSIWITRSEVYNSPTVPAGFLAGELTGKSLQSALRVTAFDSDLLRAGREMWSEATLDDYLVQNHALKGELRRQTVTRILDKQMRLKSARLNYLDIVAIYLIAAIGWIIPDLYLALKARLLKSEVEVEIARFQLLVMVLMNIEHLTVDQVLEWFEKFSRLFKIPLQRALMDYDAGAIAALQELGRASDKSDYLTLINHLISAVEVLTIKEAFSEFESEKLYYQDKRRLIGNNVVKKKIYLGQVIGFIPLYALIILYFMFPLIYVSMAEMQHYFDKLSL